MSMTVPPQHHVQQQHADANHNYIRCVLPFPHEVSRSLKSEPKLKAALYGQSLLAAIATPSSCYVYGKWVLLSKLAFPNELVDACRGEPPIVVLVPVRTPPMVVLLAPNARVCVVYRRPSDQGILVTPLPTRSDIIGTVCLDNSALIACTSSHRFCLQLLPDVANDWVLLPDPGPRSVVEALKSKVAGLLVPPPPTVVKSITTTDAGRQAIIVTNNTVERWGLSGSAAVEIKDYVKLNLEQCIFPDSSTQITRIATTRFPLLPSETAVLVVGAFHASEQKCKLHIVNDIWSKTPLPVITATHVLENDDDQLDAFSHIHQLDPVQDKVAVQSLSGVKVFSHNFSHSYLWPAGKRRFIASASGPSQPLARHNSDTVKTAAGVSLALLEATKGIYEFRSAGFSHVQPYRTPLLRNASMNIYPSSSSSISVDPNPTPKQDQVLDAIPTSLYDTVINLFRPQHGSTVPSANEIDYVVVSILGHVFESEAFTNSYTEQFEHLASVLRILASGDVDAYPRQSRENVWHGAVIAALVLERNDQGHPSAGSALFNSSILALGYDYVEKAKQLAWSLTSGSRPVPMNLLVSEALQPLAELIRVGRSDAAVDVARVLDVFEVTVEALSMVGVDAAMGVLKILTTVGNELSGPNRDALDLVILMLNMAHRGIQSSANRLQWCQAVSLLVPLASGEAYSLSQLSSAESEFLELRAMILASGYLPRFKALMLAHVSEDQPFADALFRVLLQIALHSHAGSVPAMVTSDLSLRYEHALYIATQEPLRFHAFTEKYVVAAVINAMSPPSALVFAQFYLGQPDGSRAIPFVLRYMACATTWTGARDVRGMLTLAQIVAQSTGQPMAGTDDPLLQYYDQLLDIQRQIHEVNQGALLPNPPFVVQIPPYVRKALSMGFRLPVAWMIDASGPSGLVELAKLLDSPGAYQTVSPTIVNLLWRKVFQRAAFLGATDPELGSGVFQCLTVPNIGWESAEDALKKLSHDEVIMVETEVGGVQLHLVALEDVDQTVVSYSNLVAQHLANLDDPHVCQAVDQIDGLVATAARYFNGSDHEIEVDDEMMMDET